MIKEEDESLRVTPTDLSLWLSHCQRRAVSPKCWDTGVGMFKCVCVLCVCDSCAVGLGTERYLTACIWVWIMLVVSVRQPWWHGHGAVISVYLHDDTTVALWAVLLYIQSLSSAFRQKARTSLQRSDSHCKKAPPDCESSAFDIFPVLFKLNTTTVTQHAACNLQAVCWHLIPTYEEHDRWVKESGATEL